MPGGARSVPAEPMIKLLRLLRSITDSLNAVVKKDKVMHAKKLSLLLLLLLLLLLMLCFRQCSKRFSSRVQSWRL